jgi:hypothetical protein
VSACDGDGSLFVRARVVVCFVFSTATTVTENDGRSCSDRSGPSMGTELREFDREGFSRTTTCRPQSQPLHAPSQ